MERGKEHSPACIIVKTRSILHAGIRSLRLARFGAVGAWGATLVLAVLVSVLVGWLGGFLEKKGRQNG